MTSTQRLDDIKTRADGLTELCPDYMRRGIRHLARNCDLDCPRHGEDGVETCQVPERGDGEKIARALADLPKLTAALDAVEATAAGLEAQAKDLYAKAEAMADPMYMHRARSRADAYVRIAGDLRRNINDALA